MEWETEKERHKIRYATADDNKEDYINYKQLIEELNLSLPTVRGRVSRQKVYPRLMGGTRNVYFLRADLDFEALKVADGRSILPRNCHFCEKEYIPAKAKDSTPNYCSEKCITANKLKRKKDRKKEHKRILANINTKSEIMRNKAFKKGINDDIKKIMTCSTECMLKELGDIE